MKRFLLVLACAAALLGLLAAPASAWYAPQQHTAYITSYVPYTDDGVTYSWAEWAGPSDPYGIIDRSGPIPHGYNVVVTREWFDSRLGATLIPAEYFTAMAVSRSSGCWSFAITKAACGLRYWSPAYEFGDEAGGFPVGTWARDWWVPLGKLRPGTYSGWVTQFAPRAFPSWFDWENWTLLPLSSPIMQQPADLGWTQDVSFTVAP
jgi:hypothetical protein